MACTIAVLASTHLVRQSIVQSVVPLGFRYHEFGDLTELVLGVNKVAPQLVVADIDGLEGKWRALAAALRGSQQRVALLLLAGRFGFDEAHEALALGVAGMILKPFRKEDHTARLSDLFLRSMGLRPRRAAPRFVPPEEAFASLRYTGPRGEERAAVADISLGGLGVRVSGAAAEEGSAPGAGLSRAALLLAEGEVPLSLQVVHRSEARLGLRLLRMPEGRAAFLRLVEAQHSRAFGAGGKRTRW
jgi:DNA-binding NarL/FixJ family response regulator